VGKVFISTRTPIGDFRLHPAGAPRPNETPLEVPKDKSAAPTGSAKSRFEPPRTLGEAGDRAPGPTLFLLTPFAGSDVARISWPPNRLSGFFLEPLITPAPPSKTCRRILLRGCDRAGSLRTSNGAGLGSSSSSQNQRKHNLLAKPAFVANAVAADPNPADPSSRALPCPTLSRYCSADASRCVFLSQWNGCDANG
jgi:hypothetical protein